MRWIALLAAVALICGCTQTQTKCGIEQCHGLDITCGSNVPDACTAMYQLGDFCREYFSCTAVSGSCQPVVSAKFNECKACVEGCEGSGDPITSFDCESTCRTRMEQYCEADADCSCGMRKGTDECFYGNSAYVDASRQCPDFCTGIGGNLVIKCMDRQCKQMTV